MLDLHSIYKTFNAGTVNEKTALNGLNLHLNEGDFVTVIGGNGAGKSTMLNAVAGTWFVDEGKITIDDIDVTKLPEHKRAKYLRRRAIGEAMAVMMVAGNSPNMPDSVFRSVTFLTTAIAKEMSYAGGLQRQALFSIALVLFGFIMLINIVLNVVLKGGDRDA